MKYKNLHTFSLEEIFGSIKNQIIKQNDSVRMVHLMDKKNISRTLGVVRFLNSNEVFLKDVHQKIVSGDMLGKTLFEANIDFDKEFLGAIHVELPDWLKTDFNTEQDKSLAFFSKIIIKSNLANGEDYVYSELIEVIPPEIIDSFSAKTKQFSGINGTVSILLKAADLKVITS